MRNPSGLALTVVCLAAGAATNSAQTTPDIRAAQTAIMKADEDFNQSVADRNRETFLALIADQVTLRRRVTTGFSERRAPNGTVNKGNYLTVWKKQRDGSWKAIFDGSTVPEPSIALSADS